VPPTPPPNAESAASQTHPLYAGLLQTKHTARFYAHAWQLCQSIASSSAHFHPATNSCVVEVSHHQGQYWIAVHPTLIVRVTRLLITNRATKHRHHYSSCNGAVQQVSSMHACDIPSTRICIGDVANSGHAVLQPQHILVPARTSLRLAVWMISISPLTHHHAMRHANASKPPHR